jgi:flagellar basal-body rod protein FlgC
MVDLNRSIQVAVTGLKAQSGRMRVIAENLANADSTGNAPGADPYRRRVPTFQARVDRAIGAQTVTLGRIEPDQSDFRIRHEPGHPAADANGNVKYPNVNSLIETMDMREAQRSYEANLNVIGTTRRIVQRTLDILRG